MSTSVKKTITSNKNPNENGNTTYEERQVRRFADAQCNYDILADLVDADYSINDIVKYHGVRSVNVLALRMATTAHVACHLANVNFDPRKMAHVLLQDLYTGQDLKAIMDKHKVGISNIINKIAQIAYDAFEVALSAGLTEVSIVRILAKFRGSGGPSVAECRAQVARDDSKEEGYEKLFQQNLWEVDGIPPAGIPLIHGKW